MPTGSIGLIRGLLVHGSGLTVAGMVVGQDGLAITASTLASISYVVNKFNSDGTRTQTGSGSLTPSAVVYSPPVAGDPRFPTSVLPDGYSFLATIPATDFTAEGLFHRVDVTFVPLQGEPWVQEFGGVTT